MNATRRFFAAATAIIAILFAAGPADAGHYYVTRTRDTGDGSLRWAMEQAEAHIGRDTVYFNIPESDTNFDGTVWTIQPLSPLPDLSQGGTVLDGLSQQNSRGDRNPGGPDVLVRGGGYATPSPVGFNVSSRGNTIEGLVVSGFDFAGIRLQSASARANRISTCYIGTTPDGMAPLPNGKGLVLTTGADSNLVGGVWLQNGGNLISGNRQEGVFVYASRFNRIAGNRIGTDRTTENAVPNEWNGILFVMASSGNTVGGGSDSLNVVSGNGSQGIFIDGVGTRLNRVAGNRIGTDRDGAAAVPNYSEGIRLSQYAKANILGPRNLISGNGSNGISISYVGTDSNFVIGNLIGLDAPGTNAIPNRGHGIQIQSGARYNVVGGSTADSMNVVSGNGWSGLATVDDSTGYNRFIGNRCGTDPSGETDIGNAYYGAHFGGIGNVFHGNLFSGNGAGVRIGGYSAKCVILQNQIGTGSRLNQSLPNEGDGIWVEQNVTDLLVSMNAIYYNRGFGMRLSGSGVQRVRITQNVIARNDSGGIALRDGANGGIQPPAVVSVEARDGWRVAGTGPRKTTVELFSDFGDQGGTFLGSLIPDDAGNWIWHGPEIYADHVTATVTDRDGNTSEFCASMAVPVSVPESAPAVPGGFRLHPNRPNPFNPGTVLAFNLTSAGPVTLRIFDAAGRLVSTPVLRACPAGRHEMYWEAKDASGKPLPAGLYFCRLETGEGAHTGKMMLLR